MLNRYIDNCSKRAVFLFVHLNESVKNYAFGSVFGMGATKPNLGARLM